MYLLKTSFILQEFVPPETYRKYGENSIWFINPNMVLFAQWLKEIFGNPIITINDWYWAGGRMYSGYRPPDCEIGAKESSHRRGIALDPVIAGIDPAIVRRVIRDNFAYLNSAFGVTAIEKDTETWTHVDFRWTGLDHLMEISYHKKPETDETDN